MLIRPVGKRVLVEIPKTEDICENGLIKLNTSENQPVEAIVCEVGQECNIVTVTNKVLIRKSDIQEIRMDSKIYSIITEDDILAIID